LLGVAVVVAVRVAGPTKAVCGIVALPLSTNAERACCAVTEPVTATVWTTAPASLKLKVTLRSPVQPFV